jgi:hypothetical protein
MTTNPDYFFGKETKSKLLFFEYSTEFTNNQSDLLEFYGKTDDLSEVPTGVQEAFRARGGDLFVLAYDNPAKGYPGAPGVYFDTSNNPDVQGSLKDFALAAGYDVSDSDFPTVAKHGNSHLQGVGLFPDRGPLNFRFVYHGYASDFADVATIDPKYGYFTYSYTVTAQGVSGQSVEFYDNLAENGFPELAPQLAHAHQKTQETYGSKVVQSGVSSYKFFLNSPEKKAYFRVRFA